MVVATQIILTMVQIILQHLMIIKFMFQKYMEIVCLINIMSLFLHVNLILDSDVELAPSDNPTTSTYFASMLR